MGKIGRGGGAIMLVLAAAGGAALTLAAYWPGLMTWDPVRQYGEALSGDIDDWHPPAMAWLWQRLLAIAPGPAPMLVLQVGLYWSGLAGLAVWAWRRGERVLAGALLACGLFPFGLALTGAILKDSLLAGTLLVATALTAIAGERGRIATRIAATLLLFAAATLRFNAFAAAVPLLVALLPRAMRGTAPRLIGAGLVATVALMAAMPIANRLIGAKPSGVELSLVIFDLGGITEHARTNVFPAALGVRDPVRVNHGCYKPQKWDSYSDWVEPECPLGFSAWTDAAVPAGGSPYALLAQAALAHPIAYAAHRVTHFAINTRLLPLADAVERPVPIADAPNPWGFHVAPGALRGRIDALAMATAHTPLGWPITWIALAAGALIAGRGTRHARLVSALAASSILYGGFYLLVSVAAELRYHLWTGLAALLAAVLAGAGAGAVPRRRLGWAAVPLVVAVTAGIALRLRG